METFKIIFYNLNIIMDRDTICVQFKIHISAEVLYKCFETLLLNIFSKNENL